MPRRNPSFSDRGWYQFRVFILLFFSLTLGVVDGMLSSLDRDYGTNNALSVWFCVLLGVFLGIGLFWDEIKEDVL
jgi:hypothetical protein